MNVLAKPVNRMFIIKEKDSKAFIEELNKNKASEELLKSCEKAGRLFGEVNNLNNTNGVKMCTVRSLSMANWLCSNGHKILKVEDSEKDCRFKVFLFEDTATLHHTMGRFPYDSQKKV